VNQLLSSKLLESSLKVGNSRWVKYLKNLVEQDHRAHQTPGQTGNGFFLLRFHTHWSSVNFLQHNPIDYEGHDS